LLHQAHSSYFRQYMTDRAFLSRHIDCSGAFSDGFLTFRADFSGQLS
jgi:hypothetical protein